MPDKPSIAVLPFVNMSNDPEQEYFSDGLTEDLITELAKLSGLFVIARNSVFTYKSTKEANVQARQMFEKAIELDPTYAVAYANLGWTYLVEWTLQRSLDPQVLEQAFAPAQKVVALDDSLPQAHLLLGWFYPWKKQHDQAIAEAERAIALAPNYADGYVGLAQILPYAGRSAEAIGLVEKAMRLNPNYPPVYSFILGWAYRLTGRHEEAVVALKQALAHSPNFPYGHLHLAATYSELGRMEEAQAEAAEVLRLNPNFSLEVLRRMSPQKDPAITERTVEALCKAGLK